MSPNPLPAPAAFRNTYYLLRHGRSTANEADVIVSRPDEGRLGKWGLTDEGRRQAQAAGVELRRLLGAAADHPAALLLLASPFSRTLQTATEAGAALGVAEGDPRLQVRCMFFRQGPSAVGRCDRMAATALSLELPFAPPLPPVCVCLQVDPALRERCFGDHELTSCANYELVWASDAASTASRYRRESRAAGLPLGCPSPSLLPRSPPAPPAPRTTLRRPPGEGGESVEDVAARTAGVVRWLEGEHSGRHIVLVSHGDALSILAAALLGTPLGAHWQHGLPNCGILRLGPAAA